ncbi:glycoside hydrolase family 66 protein [Globicatella sulfidifaciens]|uniref:Dextranase n=1 Tax=Globicatella sulfidifaciens TaxID=136093 RepID=A0A7X8C5Q7_9LACT|nr:glycoside hydrolase family 66 protein [Globicatella sulfidifaciens]NLJ19486.1 hypothetical protein [Globicatella sulfidifaciens]
MKKMMLFIMMIAMTIMILGCTNGTNSDQTDPQSEDNHEDSTEEITDEVEIETSFNHGEWLGQLSNDKAAYEVGETVTFTLALNDEKDFDGKDIIVKYKRLSDTIEEVQLDIIDHQLTWDWTPPEEDFTGYMVEVYLRGQDEMIDHLNIAVDVSSEWTKFPRYGYLSDYGEMSEEEQVAVIERLNRFHINSLQFYDWKDLHHIPARVIDGELASSWTDIANREVLRSSVENYIRLAHERNMKAMNYNLIFGANENYQDDGVKEEWGLYTDPSLEQQDKHPLPDSWKSSIYLMNPENREWQDYMIESQKQVFEHLDFDGWHADQLGHRGTLWDWDGNAVELDQTYASFMNYAKEELDVYMGLNSVSMYGAEEIAKSNVDYAYVEAWGETKYQDLKEIIDFHWEVSDGELSTVLAAYMNYELAGQGNPAEFNTPGVLFTDAVIFAAGGNHIELGENMLGREYFPDKTLSIPDELEHRLIRYYDFTVAYQNLLRDDLIEIEKEVSSENVLITEKPLLSAVWNFTKQKDNKEVHHFINFTDAISLDWKDEMGTQTAPDPRQDLQMSIATDQTVEKVWYATPDHEEGSAIELTFTQENDQIIFELPTLEYWSMVVVEY